MIVEGKNLYDSESIFIKERKRFSFEGLVLVSIIINKDYSVEKNIILSARGLPEFDQLLILNEFKPIFIDNYLKLSDDQKNSDQSISELIKKNIRKIVKNYFQKKPEVNVHIFRN